MHLVIPGAAMYYVLVQKLTFLPVLHRKMKKIEGLLQNLKKIALFEIIVRTGISLQKFL